MSYNAIIKFCYVNDTEVSHNQYFPEIVDKQTITIEAPAQDLNTHQYFELFKSFLRAVGFDEYGIIDGACRVAFNDCNREDDMEKLMKEYDLQDKQFYSVDDYHALLKEVEELKEKLARVLPEQYEKGDEVLPEMYKDWSGNWNGLVPGSDEAYAQGCKCPILDNQEMPDHKKWVNADCPLHGKVE
jgi:FMN phosphatase YigB (HAD superfamily)